MHKVNAIVLLAVFVLHLLVPVFPWVEYYANKAYIIQNLCIERTAEVNTCNGNCHLKKEIAKVSDEQGQDDKKLPVPNRDIKAEIYLFAETASGKFEGISHVKTCFPEQGINYTYSYVNRHFHPPKFTI
jgi:hypothetical protein